MVIITEDTRNEMVAIAEGNPGAIATMREILAANFQYRGCFEHLKTMRLTGSKLWVAYSDICKKNIELLVKLIYADDESLVYGVNEYVQHGACGEGVPLARTRAQAAAEETKPHVFEVSIRKEKHRDEINEFTVFTLRTKIDKQLFAFDQRVHDMQMLQTNDPQPMLDHMHEYMCRELGYAMVKYMLGEPVAK